VLWSVVPMLRIMTVRPGTSLRVRLLPGLPHNLMYRSNRRYKRARDSMARYGIGNLRGTRPRGTAGRGSSWAIFSSSRRSTIFRPLSEGTIYRFQHTIIVEAAIYCGNTTTGFNLSGTTANTNNCGVRMHFTPRSVTLENSNSGTNTTSVKNNTAYADLYEQVRLNAVKVKVFWSATQANVGVTTALANNALAPLLQTVFDADKDAVIPDIDENLLASYPGMKTCQLGSSAAGRNSGASMELVIYPKTTAYADSPYQVMQPQGTWLSIENGGLDSSYFGQLFYLDIMKFNNVVSSNNAVGAVSFYVTLDVSYRGLR